MSGYKSFSEFLEQRDAANYAARQSSGPDAGGFDPVARSRFHDDSPQSDTAGNEGQVEARSMFGSLFKSPFKAVNPARPVSPTNSRLLASPFGKRRLRSQVIGK